ncbi:MAG: tetratricopeptide repeat protein [Planctomycetota bacterium]|jgi:tetratricopeptide (TPR) repeat protein
MPRGGQRPGSTYAAAKARLEERIAAEPANAELGLELGMLALVAGDLATAEAAIRRASDTEPEDPRAHVRLADVYVEQGRLDEASEEYARALALAEGSRVGEEARLELELVEREIEMVQRPLAEAREAAGADPADVNALNRLGCLELLAGAIDRAAEAFRRGLEAAPESLQAALNFGLVQGLAYVEPSGLKRSVGELLAASKRFPKEPRLHLHLAELYEASSLYEASTQRVGEALDAAPSCLEAYDIASRYGLVDTGGEGPPPLERKIEEIVAHLEGELESAPDEPSRKRALALALLGRARYRAAAAGGSGARSGLPHEAGPRGDDVGRACALLEEVVDHDEEVAIRLAECRERSGREEDAEALLNCAAEEHPDSYKPVFELAGLRLRTGRPDEAVELFAKAAELAPAEATVYQSLRYALSTARSLRLAELAAKVELARDPESAGARVRLGVAYTEAHRLGAAVETLEEAVKLAPKSAEAHTALGRALAHLDRSDEAEASLRRAVEIAPEWPEAHRRLGDLLLSRPGRTREGLEELETYRKLKAEGGKR